MEKCKAVYKSYLLRLWWHEENGRFRIRLQTIEEEPVTLLFADLDSFAAFWLQFPSGGLKITKSGGE